MHESDFTKYQDDLAKAVYVLKRCAFRYGQFVFIPGTDAFSVLVGALAKKSGAAAVVCRAGTDAINKRATAFGFRVYDPALEDEKAMISDVTDGRKFDIAVETTGEAAAYEICFRLMKRGAHMALLKALPEPLHCHICDQIRDQIDFIGIKTADGQSQAAAEAFFASGQLNPIMEILADLDLLNELKGGASF